MTVKLLAARGAAGEDDGARGVSTRGKSSKGAAEGETARLPHSVVANGVGDDGAAGVSARHAIISSKTGTQMRRMDIIIAV